MKKNLKYIALCAVALTAVTTVATPALNPIFGEVGTVQAAETQAETKLKALLVPDAVTLRGAFTDADADFLIKGKTKDATTANLKVLFKDSTSGNIIQALADAMCTGDTQEYTVKDDKGNTIQSTEGKDVKGTYAKGKSKVDEAELFLRDKADLKSMSIKLDSAFSKLTDTAALNKLAVKTDDKDTKVTFGVVVTCFDTDKNFTVAGSILVKEPTLKMDTLSAKVEDTYTNGLTFTDYNGTKLAVNKDQSVTTGDYKDYNYVYPADTKNFIDENVIGYAKYEPMTELKDGKFTKVGEFKEKITFVRFDTTGKPNKELTYTADRTVTVKEKDVVKPEPTVKAVTLYRAYNMNDGEHLYTTDKAEHAAAVKAGWKDEGTAWNAASEGTAVYRLYNPNSGEHFYTTDVKEYGEVAAKGWTKEGLAFYSNDEKTVPVYRLYNPNTTLAGSHHYTTSSSERDNLVAKGWRAEGVGFYGVAAAN